MPGTGKRWLSLSLPVVLVLGLAVLPARAAHRQKDDLKDIGNRKIAHRSLISEQSEISTGREYADEIDRSARLITDPVVTEYVNRVAQNVARNSDLKIPLTVKVIDAPEINAFALPGGFLYVNSGLIEAADEEDQIAGVMAHEIAHVAARHWASQVTKFTLLRYATIPLIFVPMSYPVYLGVSNALNFAVPLTFLKFSRNDESEADFLGLQYMYKAGYDPNSYVTFFGKVSEEERHEPGSVPKVFMDHPPTADRIIKCVEEVNALLPQRQEYLVSTSEFSDVQARLESDINAQRLANASRGPRLERRAGSTPSDKSAKDQGSDTPPVLHRRSER